MTSLVALAAVPFVHDVAAAQEGPAVAAPSAEAARVDAEDDAEGAGAFFVGPGGFYEGTLNERLEAAGYERLPRFRTVLGGEGHAVFPSGFVAGAHGAGVLGAASTGPSGYEAQLSGGFGALDFGFALVHTAPMLVTLTASIGGWGMGLDVSSGQSASFDAVLRDPRRGASMSHGGLLAGVTLGVDGRVRLSPVKNGKQGFFTIGVRLSALYGPPLGHWDLDGDAQATAAPNFGLTGGYLAVALGFGGGRVKASGAK